jgi:hypothetical protein
MWRINAGRTLVVPAIACVLFTALAGASVLNLAATDVAEAQTEPVTAANGVLLPPPNYDPVAARNEGVAESATVPATPKPAAPPADGSIGTDTPQNGNSVTTSLGGSDVMVSSVGGSNEIDRPDNRSRSK